MPGITAAMLRHAAMNLLAQREYSRKELFRKLGLLSQDNELIDEVLNWLESDRLLSNDRFVEGFIRSRIQKGHGPMRISQDLRQKGVASEVISLALEAAEGIGMNWQKTPAKRSLARLPLQMQRKRHGKFAFCNIGVFLPVW